MDIYQYKSLFDKTNNLLKTYKKIGEISGEDFNVFRVLKLESLEVNMHSAFLAELLNPHGSHGQKHVFLKLFIDFFCFKEHPIDTTSCKVEIEKYIGSIRENETQGGIIDIIITDRNNTQIIIENKIYADDQKNQLLRYYNYSKNANLIYLTLDGRQPSDLSKGNLEEGIHFKSFSYRHDILNWLELCRKEVVVNPTVREGITHYINLIKYLTNQTINQSMQEEISNLILANLEASIAVRDNLDIVCIKIIEDFFESFKEKCEELGLECQNDIDFWKKNTGISITKPDWEFTHFAIQFSYYDKKLIYGIQSKGNPNKFTIPDSVIKTIYNLPNNDLGKPYWWLYLKHFENPYNDWSKYAAWKAIEDGSMETVMIEKVNFLLEITNGLEL